MDGHGTVLRRSDGFLAVKLRKKKRTKTMSYGGGYGE